VDGQQRIRSIIEFADNKFRLTKRSEDFEGHDYKSLDDEQKQAFLGYTVTVEQLLNATDDDVIDIFARLNSYTVTLNSAEKRHAEYQTEFKFAVRKASEKYRPFLERYKIFSTKQRFRMADDEFFAELFGVILQGVTDGGAVKINKLYKSQNDDIFTETAQKSIFDKLSYVLDYIDNTIPDILSGMLAKHYQLLLFIAAILYHKYGIPEGQIGRLPPRKSLASKDKIIKGVAELERAFNLDSPPAKYKHFIEASSSSTHRISSRRPRFLLFCDIFGA
jgi:hypothetical protein